MGASESSLNIAPLLSESGALLETVHIPKVPEWLDQCEEQSVYLYVYDMTKGCSPAFSTFFSRFHFDALWHTSIVIFGREYSFGQQGIRVNEPGTPTRKINLAHAHVSRQALYEYIMGLRMNFFNKATYDVFHRNCNTFSDCLSEFLTGDSIPYEYRTFGLRMLDQCVQHYNIRTQDELFKYLQTIQS